jgi:hypothetical protein
VSDEITAVIRWRPVWAIGTIFREGMMHVEDVAVVLVAFSPNTNESARTMRIGVLFRSGPHLGSCGLMAR